MSKIGRKPITIPQEVTIEIKNNFIIAKGPKGEDKLKIHPRISLKKEDHRVLVKVPSESKQDKALQGLYRSLIANLVEGVWHGFEKKLILVGVGYRASLANTEDGKQKLILSVGYSHPIEMIAPQGIQFAVQKNQITVSGINKQQVGEIAAKIRAVRPPEPYKGKGIRYIDEVVRRKAGKALAKSGG